MTFFKRLIFWLFSIDSFLQASSPAPGRTFQKVIDDAGFVFYNFAAIDFLQYPRPNGEWNIGSIQQIPAMPIQIDNVPEFCLTRIVG